MLGTTTFKGVVYRAHNPKWSWPADSGEGARLYGGRFNEMGTPALYTSLDIETAIVEAQQGFFNKMQPLLLCSYKVNCVDVVDLTTPENQQELQNCGLNLGCDWEYSFMNGICPDTWSLSKSLIQQGTAAVIVPSFANAAKPQSKNMVFWNWDIDTPHQVSLIDDEGRLPLV